MAKGPSVALFMGKIVAGCSIKAINKGNYYFTCHWHIQCLRSSSICSNYAIFEQCMKADEEVMECCFFFCYALASYSNVTTFNSQLFNRHFTGYDSNNYCYYHA